MKSIFSLYSKDTTMNRLPLMPLPKQYYNPKFVQYSPPILDQPSRSKRPLVAIVLDWILLIAMFVVIQYLYSTPQPAKAYFSVTDESLKYPEVPEIISSTMATIINAVLPLVILAVLELLLWFDKWDAYHMVKGHAESIAISLFFTSLFWIIIGGGIGLRPTFITKCQPNPDLIKPNQTYYDTSVCTQMLAKFEFQGFPSGHSATAFAGWLFFVLYLNAKLKPYSGGGAHLWKILILIGPLAFSVWVSMTRVIDFHHFPYQIICGGLIGISAALTAFRLNFGGPLDWFLGVGGRDDHIPVSYTRMEQVTERELALEDMPLSRNVNEELLNNV